MDLTNLFRLTINTEGIRYLINKGISKRELSIIQSIFIDSNYKEVGKRLFISEKTVKYHMTSILKKLNLKSRAALLSHLVIYLEKYQQEENKNLSQGPENILPHSKCLKKI